MSVASALLVAEPACLFAGAAAAYPVTRLGEVEVGWYIPKTLFILSDSRSE